MIGVANASFDYAHTQAFDVNAAGLGEDSGSVWVNNVSNNANLFTCAGVGQYGACAVDLDNKLIWFKGQGWGDLWYYSAFPVGPDGGGSGVDISSIVSGPMYMVIGTLGGGQSTVNFGATAWHYSLPSGYSAW
jgi:hypothetical protein